MLGECPVIRDLWEGLSALARAGLVAGAICIAVAMGVFSYWALHTDYQVLFSDLTPQDSAAMVAELDRLKVPYQLGDQGTSILVARDQVYKTRIKLMGKDLPLHGAVGLELFNNSDFGMTEFAQKINYQRALQGELTRTILSLSEIHDVRVHLALPEQGLFKQAGSRAKAAVTLTLKQGQVLRPEQITGIQRLVSASVPGIATQDVTIVDQHGVALTRASGAEGEIDATSGRLDLKKETENYLQRKVADVLERSFGPGQSIASVDVTLDMDRIQTTTEDVIPAASRTGHTPSGVVTRERESVRDNGAPLDTRVADASGGARGGSSQRETDYAVGRRVEQVVSQPGSVRRIQVVAMVRTPLDADQQERLRRLVAAAAGASFERGDSVVVQPLGALVTQGAVDAPADTVAQAGLPAALNERGDARGRDGAVLFNGLASDRLLVAGALLVLLMGTGLGVLLSRLRSQPTVRATGQGTAKGLTVTQRDAALAQVEVWMRGNVARDGGRSAT
ncbi:putative Flagellar M-ring protein FliF [Ralstonia solanacearum CMR15]|nr:putative Flagellar M-ring protein FliF [Ralstonia solanacearum CMR15]